MYKSGILFFVLLSCFISVFGQISPPGLGKANSASWYALGLRQSLDTGNKRQLMTYFGLGRISNPDNYNLSQKPAIIVINSEYYNQFADHWQYSVALSYRRQNQYSDLTPYESENPAIQQEFRLYFRYSYILKNSRFKFVNTFRPEFRKFYTPDFSAPDETFQFRSRLRTQLTFNIDNAKIHRLIMSAEALFSISKEGAPEKKWSGFDYQESRFCFYYSLSPQRSPLVFNLGYMNDMIGSGSITDVHYLSMDVIWENPFGDPKHKKVKPIEYFE